MPTNDPLSYFYPGIPTDQQRLPKRSFTNADVEPSNEPFQDTVYGPWTSARNPVDDIPDMDNFDEIMSGATSALKGAPDFGAYRDAQLASHTARQASEATPMPSGRHAAVAAASPLLLAGGPLSMGAGALMAGSSAVDFAEDPSYGSAIMGLLGLAPVLGPITRGTLAAGRAVGSAASRYGQQATSGLQRAASRFDDSRNAISPHMRAVASGQQKAVEADKGFDILKQQRLGDAEPSASYSRTLRQHAGEAEGIPSASMRGPREVTDISHGQLPPYEPTFGRIVTPEQIKQHSFPQEYLNQLGRMLGRIGRGF